MRTIPSGKLHAALVPPSRVHLVRYHGILAPHAKNRDKIVPKKPAEEEMPKTRGLIKNRLLWAALLARTFGLTVEACSNCGGRAGGSHIQRGRTWTPNGVVDCVDFLVWLVEN